MDNNKEFYNYYLTLNINSICRICLEKPNLPEKLTPIFDVIKPTNLSNLIMACAAVQINENDGLPNNMCENCMTDLQIAYQFKIKCEQSDVRLREILCATTATIIGEDGSEYSTENNDASTIIKSTVNANNVFNILTTDINETNGTISINAENFDLNSTTLNLNSNSLNLHSDNLNTNNLNLDAENLNLSSNTILIHTSPNELNEIKVDRPKLNNKILTDSSAYVFKPNFVINIDTLSDSITPKAIITVPTFGSNQPDLITVKRINSEVSTFESNASDQPDIITVKRIDSEDQTLLTKDNVLVKDEEFLIFHKNDESAVIDSQVEKENNEILINEENIIKSECGAQKDSKSQVNDAVLTQYKLSKKRTITRQQKYVRLPKIPKKHQCDTCGKVFKAKQGLIQHLRIHSGERPYVCHLCNKRFINGGHLHTHMRTHTGEKRHKCTSCIKAFATAQQLQKHVIAIHTNDRPYQCSFCPKRCASSSNLTTHIRIHTGEKNYHCDRCPKAFSTKGQLLQHILIHTGQKPFECGHCRKRFTQRAHLTRHLKMHFA